ncbi:hypothetical protein [Endozoicomonas sp. OPT23]|uniref:hypothetical protein n=1 Tax=Endozoicomonas sp. OPT23 TaxID=2072845 RepID=UPI00129B69E2|nr:hypothetical protein [Endozoicomonas sp. OPT23]
MEPDQSINADYVEKISGTARMLTGSIGLILSVFLIRYLGLLDATLLNGVALFVVVIFWLGVLRLAWLTSGKPTVAITFLLIILAPFLLIPMIVCWGRAKKLLADHGYRLTIMGAEGPL